MPHFAGRQVYGEPWIECAICGFDLPRSKAVRHYKSKKLIDRKCADQMAQPDYLEFMILPTDANRVSEQPVSDQGGTSPTEGYGVSYGDDGFGV